MRRQPVGEASAEVTVVVHKPVAEVFAVMSDYNKNVHWQEGVIASRQVTPGPPAVGAEVSYVRQIAGRKLEAKATITALETDARIRIESSSRMYTYHGGYDFQSTTEGHTTIHYQGRITTGRLLGLFAKRLADGFTTQMTTDLNHLKTLLETDRFPHGG
ncbi:MAG: SRPBCC family protein [Myxococcota bacterium]